MLKYEVQKHLGDNEWAEIPARLAGGGEEGSLRIQGQGRKGFTSERMTLIRDLAFACRKGEGVVVFWVGEYNLEKLRSNFAAKLPAQVGKAVESSVSRQSGGVKISLQVGEPLYDVHPLVQLVRKFRRGQYLLIPPRFQGELEGFEGVDLLSVTNEQLMVEPTTPVEGDGIMDTTPQEWKDALTLMKTWEDVIVHCGDDNTVYWMEGLYQFLTFHSHLITRLAIGSQVRKTFEISI